jgi:hypothetical protein
LTLVPYKIAYVEDTSYPEWDILDNVIDSIFLLDMVLTFFSAYYDNQNNLVTSWKQILKNYLKTWFLVDLIVTHLKFSQFFKKKASFPFYFFTEEDGKLRIARISRLPRLYRLLKMTKLARTLRIYNDRSTWFMFIRINASVERVIITNLILVIACHIVSCLWYLVG